MIFQAISKQNLNLMEFYRDHQSNMLLDPIECINIDGRESYCVLNDDGEIIATTSLEYITHHLARMNTTLVHPGYRGKGVGKFLNQEVEKLLKKKGYGKVASYIYIENIPSIVLKLNLGYVVEGTLRDHDFIGQHEYVLGKLL